MIKSEKYTLRSDSAIMDALRKLEELSFESISAMFVIDDSLKVVGSITAGDVRRALLSGKTLDSSVNEVMNVDFTYLRQDCFDTDKLKFIKKEQLKVVPIIDEQGSLVNILNFQTKKTYLPIDAVLMAGGKGERLRPMTLTTPKPLLKVGDKPIIDYNLENLANHGIAHISVTVNYLAEQLEEHFVKPKYGVQVECVREPKFLGTMGSIKFVKEWHNDTVLVMNSDLFTNIDLEDFYLHFKEHNADMSIAAVPYSVNIPYGIFEIENTREIKGVKEKPSFHYYANAGIYLIKKEVLDIIPEGEFFNATDLMELLMKQSKNIIRFPLSGYWIDIGKPEDFKKVQDIAHHLHK